MKTKVFFLLILISLLAGRVKADTLYYQTPQSSQYLCVDTNNFPTFVVYKPNGFGGTVWFLNGQYYGTGDSVVYSPSLIGLYSFGANWDGNVEGIGFTLYSQVPVHTDFANDGIDGIDTLYRCGENISVSACSNPNGEYSQLYQGPNGYSIHNINTVVITNPGMYIHTRENTCGATPDSFFVMVPPTTLPVFTDTSFCNTPVVLTLDPGPGWHYSWNTGETTQTIDVDTTGTYIVSLFNSCLSGTASLTVEHQSYPVPDLFYQLTGTLCADSVAILDPSPGYAYDTYQWQWPSGTATDSILLISGLTTGNGVYEVTVTQGGCSGYAYVEFVFFNMPVEPEICIVTVDATLNKNMIVWTADVEPNEWSTNYSQTAGYNVYKWAGGNNWPLLGFVSADQEHIFTDITSSPPNVSARYKIAMVDNCGVESPKTYYHQTILLSVMAGSNPNEIPLIWTEYRDENNTFVVDQYQIWRGNHPDSLEFYTETPFTSYNDVGVYNQMYYQIVVTKSGGCDPAPAGSKGGEKSLITSSASNITNNIVTDIPTVDLEMFISIYPNPALDGIFNLAKPVASIEVFNISGQLVASFSNTEIIDLSGYPAGVYRARISNGLGSTNRTLVLQ